MEMSPLVPLLESLTKIREALEESCSGKKSCCSAKEGKTTPKMMLKRKMRLKKKLKDKLLLSRESK